MSPYGEIRASLDKIGEKAEALLTESGRQRQLQNKVWVVEDEPEVAEGLVVMLTVAGVDAEPVLGTASAIAKLKDQAPALMLLDLAMPGGGGNAVLRECPPGFPVLVLTCAAEPEDAMDEVMRGRVKGVLPKTMDPGQLVKLVKALLEPGARR